MLLIPVLLTSATVSCAGGRRAELKDGADVILHDHGRVQRTKDETAGLVEMILESLRTCDGIYELVVTEETVEGLRAAERCVEAAFPAPLEVVVGGRETLGILRILIPLTGRFAERDQVTIFCGFPEYSAGPYLNTEGLRVLIRKVDGLRWY
jgi:hypothetical protein